jgi:hypothetical protein
MKKIIKTFSLMLLIASTSSFAETSTILLSEGKGGYNIDFLNSDAITALQFDIAIDGANLKNLSLGSCVSGLAKTHTGSCNLNKNGSVRVVIFSTSNAVLESGNIGTFDIKGDNVSEMKINNLLMGTADLKEINGDTVIDLNNKRNFLIDDVKLK